MIRLSHPGVRGGFSTRRDGDLAFWSQTEDKLKAGWEKLTAGEVKGLPLPLFAHQVHEDQILTIADSRQPGGQGPADGLVCSAVGVPIGVFTADCLPVLIAGKKSVAAIHSGWRSAARDIAGKAVRRMFETGSESPAHLEVWLGPCIGACCLEMGDEVPPQFINRDPAAAGFFSRGRKWHLDLRGLVTMQVLRAGIAAAHVHQICDCTKCLSDDYFSYRGQKGRQGSMFSWIVRVQDE